MVQQEKTTSKDDKMILRCYANGCGESQLRTEIDMVEHGCSSVEQFDKDHGKGSWKRLKNGDGWLWYKRLINETDCIYFDDTGTARFR